MDTTIFFCSDQENKYTTESFRHIFSQWYNSGKKFIHNKSLYDIPVIDETDLTNKEFWTREQYMMYCKALLMKDPKSANILLNTVKPSVCRSLGRKIQNFDQNLWNDYKYKIVANGNYLQFNQNPEMQKILLDTQNREIVEAASYDKIWGIGFNEENAKNTDKTKWGQNLLGKAIMEIRALLQKIDKK